ncbi:hypothetical protein [Gymnodinialimonas sp.]
MSQETMLDVVADLLEAAKHHDFPISSCFQVKLIEAFLLDIGKSEEEVNEILGFQAMNTRRIVAPSDLFF